MSESESRRNIEEHFAAQWAAGAYAAVPIAWTNVAFEPPASDWLRLTVRNSVTNFPETGDRVTRTTGVVFIQVFVREGTGAARALQLSDSVAQIFRGRAIGGVKFGAPNVTDVGEAEGPYYQVNVEAPFQYDYFH